MNELIIFEYGADNKPIETHPGQYKRYSNSTMGDVKYLEDRMDDLTKQFPSKKLAIVEAKIVYDIVKSNSLLSEALKKVKTVRTESKGC